MAVIDIKSPCSTFDGGLIEFSSPNTTKYGNIIDTNNYNSIAFGVAIENTGATAGEITFVVEQSDSSTFSTGVTTIPATDLDTQTYDTLIIKYDESPDPEFAIAYRKVFLIGIYNRYLRIKATASSNAVFGTNILVKALISAEPILKPDQTQQVNFDYSARNA